MNSRTINERRPDQTKLDSLMVHNGSRGCYDAGLWRTWALGGDWQVTLRAEAVNLANSPQFAEPGVVLTSPSFGQINNTLKNGRTFRFLLMFSY